MCHHGLVCYNENGHLLLRICADHSLILLLPSAAAEGDLDASRSRNWHRLDFALIRMPDEQDVLVILHLQDEDSY
ncbi:unnamed protein product [Schistocephalus solidus]|uniref:LAM_G_DOMAIN domain-containing protein n=1 Tax=Schistocephalus solidus TaxID=70667 RepID=A0A183TRJ3_SCHSO|nr:unnamed protein product [Schistocephalus solidus]